LELEGDEDGEVKMIKPLPKQYSSTQTKELLEGTKAVLDSGT